MRNITDDNADDRNDAKALDCSRLAMWCAVVVARNNDDVQLSQPDAIAKDS